MPASSRKRFSRSRAGAVTGLFTALLTLACAGSEPSVDIALSKRADLMKQCEAAEADACAELGADYALGTSGAKTPGAAAKPLMRACKAGRGDSCGLLGNLVRDCKAAAPAGQTAADLYQKDCDAKSKLSCNNLGLLITKTEPNAPTAVDAFEQACALNERWGCFNLAMMVGSGRGTATDEARGKELLEKSCQLDHGQACATVAGFVRSADPALAAELEQKACDLGFSDACS